ncbi:MAG: DUF1570 domain-containing protein [Pirellulales bacterium]|nr:DUF1570 domain-containing protein [Pirellulales bacterium]
MIDPRLALLTVLAIGVMPQILAAGEPMLRGTYQGRIIEGRHLYQTSSELGFLARDGQWLRLEPSRLQDVRQISPQFRSLSAAVMRSQLTSEFGRNYEVTGTGHFLVVHPKGESRQWASQFEKLYRNFVHYFSVRGLNLRQPEFPLVAVVWRDRTAFLKAAYREGAKLPEGVLGYYSQRTNRIMLYDQSGGKKTPSLSSPTMATVIHEATHQTAYNTGVHNRFGQTPRWVVEGLGTMFESPGVWNSHRYRGRQNRIDKNRLANFRQYQKRRSPTAIANLLSSDRVFQQDVEAAYAESWALTLYLVETMPQQYCRFLKITAAKPDFRAYPSGKRLADFQAVFRRDLRLLDAQFIRFMDSL